MINLFDAKATDFTTLGLAVLDPYVISATITERLNGEYNLSMELVIDPMTVGIKTEQVLRVPAPVRITPEIEPTKSEQREIYRVNTNSKRLTMRSKPTYDSGYVIHSYNKGTEMILKEKTTTTMYKMVGPDGNTGYMLAQYLQYVRTEGGTPIDNGTIKPHATRDQLFRINRISSTLDSISVDALHISYDLRRNYVPALSIANMTGAQALNEVLTKAVTSHEFTGYSDISATMAESLTAAKTVSAAILSDGGLISQGGGELLRDNFDLYWVQHIGENRGVSVAYKKNMAGMDVQVNTDELVTRIVPIVYSKEGKPITCPNVDSAHINEYHQPYIAIREYKDVKVGSGGFTTEAKAKAEAAKRAQQEFTDGVDLPQLTATLDFVSLKNTDIGQELPVLDYIFMGDTIYVRHEDYGFNFAVEVNAYEWDCLAEDFISIQLGDRRAAYSEIISPRQIRSGSISWRMLDARAGAYLDLEGNASVENAVGAGMASISGNFVSNAGGEVSGNLGALGNMHISSADYASVHMRRSPTDINRASYRANTQTGRAQIMERVPETEAAEFYNFPVPNAAQDVNYSILTSKAPVTVEQGGTGAKSAQPARHNLGIYFESGVLNVGTTGVDVPLHVSFPGTPIVLATGNKAGYVYVTNVTRTGFTVTSSTSSNRVQWIAIYIPVTPDV